jgi:glyceraldehyde-3-phosphate dehydrogenase (NADP+)
LISNVNLNAKVAWEEQFGPILPIIKFKDISEAIDIANKSSLGLQASIFTKNLDLAEDIAIKIETGTVNINKSSSRGPDILPFFGIKDSGFGIQGIKYAILSMNRLKGIVNNK